MYGNSVTQVSGGYPIRHYDFFPILSFKEWFFKFNEFLEQTFRFRQVLKIYKNFLRPFGIDQFGNEFFNISKVITDWFFSVLKPNHLFHWEDMKWGIDFSRYLNGFLEGSDLLRLFNGKFLQIGSDLLLWLS